MSCTRNYLASLLGGEGTHKQIKKFSFLDICMANSVIKLDVYEEHMGFLSIVEYMPSMEAVGSIRP